MRRFLSSLHSLRVAAHGMRRVSVYMYRESPQTAVSQCASLDPSLQVLRAKFMCNNSETLHSLSIRFFFRFQAAFVCKVFLASACCRYGSAACSAHGSFCCSWDCRPLNMRPTGSFDAATCESSFMSKRPAWVLLSVCIVQLDAHGLCAWLTATFGLFV